MENYRIWLRGMRNLELNEELKKVLKKADTTTGKAKEAWLKMYDLAVAEMYRRDK
jgi:hypothetical protein